MSCPDFETIIVEIARDRLMDAGERDRGLEHVRRCSSCSTLLAEERALSRDLRALSVEGAAGEISECVETALLAAFRRRAAPPAPVSVSAARNQRRALAVAALVLLTFGLAVAVWSAASAKRESPSRVSTGGVAGSTPEAVSTPEISRRPSPIVADRQPDRPIVSPASEKSRKRLMETRADRRQAGAIPGDIAPSEFVTQFFPVMQGGDLIPLESGRIVRVKMPRSNLIPLGIPFNQERANETIKADVLLSNDGLARAIRLVY
jgi:hypothetical protein